MRIKGYREPILNLHRQVSLVLRWLMRTGGASILKLFSIGLYRCKIAENQCSWPSRLPGVSSEVCLIHMRRKIKTSFDVLPENFA